MTHVPPGLEDQVHEASVSTCQALTDIVRAGHPHLRGAAALPPWVLPLIKQFLTIILGLLSTPAQPE